MKTLTITITILLVFASLTSIAQECSTFYPFTEGTVSTVTSYNKKGKVNGKQKITIISKRTDTGYETATAQAKLMDRKGKVITETTFNITCKNDGVEIDIASIMSPNLFNQFKDMETEISGTNIILPNNITIGDKLPDAEMFMKIDASGIIMNMEITMINRKVIAQENITTPAGMFECYVISYNSKTKMGISKNGQAKQWVAKGVGLVKQEDYNKKGKIINSNLLTAFSK